MVVVGPVFKSMDPEYCPGQRLNCLELCFYFSNDLYYAFDDDCLYEFEIWEYLVDSSKPPHGLSAVLRVAAHGSGNKILLDPVKSG